MRTAALCLILGASALSSAATLAQEPWIDAGQQHMLQHQGAHAAAPPSPSDYV